jgi:ribosomal protein S18 acetylase RimI-like enzyme
MTGRPLALQPPDPRVPMRPVRLADVENLWSNCWRQRPFAAVYNLVSRICQYARDGRGLGIVVEADGQIRGYGQYIVWPTCGEISDLVVAEAYRGKGLGTALIQSLTRSACQSGLDAVEIGAALGNQRATALYRRLGFEDSHSLMLNLGAGREPVLFLRLDLHG